MIVLRVRGAAGGDVALTRSEADMLATVLRRLPSNTWPAGVHFASVLEGADADEVEGVGVEFDAAEKAALREAVRRTSGSADRPGLELLRQELFELDAGEYE